NFRWMVFCEQPDVMVFVGEPEIRTHASLPGLRRSIHSVPLAFVDGSAFDSFHQPCMLSVSAGFSRTISAMVTNGSTGLAAVCVFSSLGTEPLGTADAADGMKVTRSARQVNVSARFMPKIVVRPAHALRRHPAILDPHVQEE